MTAPDQSAHITRRFAYGVRHPKQWMTDLCGGEAAFPLLILFGLNAVDELDRTAFGVLLPEIRESFNINISTALSIVALSSVAALALQVPIADHWVAPFEAFEEFLKRKVEGPPQGSPS